MHRRAGRGSSLQAAVEEIVQQPRCPAGPVEALHELGGRRRSGPNCRIREQRFEILGEFFICPVAAVHLEAVAGFLNPGRVVVSVPYVGCGDRRIAPAFVLQKA